jgi:hypothetical protein
MLNLQNIYVQKVNFSFFFSKLGREISFAT